MAGGEGSGFSSNRLDLVKQKPFTNLTFLMLPFLFVLPSFRVIFVLFYFCKIEKENGKEDLEKEIDVVGMEEDVICSQDIETFPPKRAHEIQEENGADAKEVTPVTVSSVSVADKVIDTVAQLLNDIVDTVCKLYQSSQNKAGIRVNALLKVKSVTTWFLAQSAGIFFCFFFVCGILGRAVRSRKKCT